MIAACPRATVTACFFPQIAVLTAKAKRVL